MEESLQARVSLEQIFSLPELKVPAPLPAPSRQAVTIPFWSFLCLALTSPGAARAFPKSPRGMIWNGVFQIGILETHSWRVKRRLVL